MLLKKKYDLDKKKKQVFKFKKLECQNSYNMGDKKFNSNSMSFEDGRRIQSDYKKHKHNRLQVSTKNYIQGRLTMFQKELNYSSASKNHNAVSYI